MIVIDMDMPKSCNECPLFDNEYLHCQKTKERCETWAFEPTKSCPIKCDIEQIRAEIVETQKNTIDWSRSAGLIDALDIIDKYAEQEPCDDAVSRQAVLDITWEEPSYTDALNVLTEVRDKVKSLPSVRPQETVTEFADRCRECGKQYVKRRTGHWIYDNIANNWRCDKCGETPKTMGYVGTADFMSEHFRFCNHCGARMVEQRETETWHGIHAQITAPNGTFERIFNEADDDYDI